MKKLVLGSPPRDVERFIEWASAALAQIEQASFEDAELIFDDFTVSGDYAPTRQLDASSATLDELRAVVATLLDDMANRGQSRNYD